jgi:transposase IS66-like protein
LGLDHDRTRSRSRAPSPVPAKEPQGCTLIETAKLDGIDPQAWLADTLARLPDHPMRRIDELLA